MTASVYHKTLESILKKMNAAAGGTEHDQKVTGLTAHMFRHNYCASLCYQMPNISIKKISQLLGDTEKMVLEVYNHILEEKENVKEVVSDAMLFEDKLKIMRFKIRIEDELKCETR